MENDGQQDISPLKLPGRKTLIDPLALPAFRVTPWPQKLILLSGNKRAN